MSLKKFLKSVGILTASFLNLDFKIRRVDLVCISQVAKQDGMVGLKRYFVVRGSLCM